MSITALSTITEIEAEIVTSLGYERTGSAALAWAVVEACNTWLLKRPNAMSAEGHSINLNAEQVAVIRDNAREYAIHRGGSGAGAVRHFSMNEGFR